MDVFELTREFYQNQTEQEVQDFLVTTSTNSIAKTLAPHPGSIVLLARSQTQGRGQSDRSWSNAEDSQGQLLVTYSRFFTSPPQPHLTTAVGIALHQSLVTTWPELSLRLKLPNDIYVGTKKCAGLLIETVSLGSHFQMVLGLGLNVFSYPKSISTANALFSSSDFLIPSKWLTFLQYWETNRNQALSDCWEQLTPPYKEYLSKFLI